jgi:DNA-directed RNA polymerases I and III subunit RPAC1
VPECDLWSYKFVKILARNLWKDSKNWPLLLYAIYNKPIIFFLYTGTPRAVVARPRSCTLCRECIMEPTEKKIELRRVRDHFICKSWRPALYLIITLSIITPSWPWYAARQRCNLLPFCHCPSFLVTIESTGALPPEVLFTEAVKILEEKCKRVISELS